MFDSLFLKAQNIRNHLNCKARTDFDQNFSTATVDAHVFTPIWYRGEMGIRVIVISKIDHDEAFLSLSCHSGFHFFR